MRRGRPGGWRTLGHRSCTSACPRGCDQRLRLGDVQGDASAERRRKWARTRRWQNPQDVKSQWGTGDEDDAQPSSLDSRVAGGAGEGPREDMGLAGGGTSIFGKSRTMRSLWIAWRSVQWGLVCGSLEHSEGTRLERERRGAVSSEMDVGPWL